LKKKKKMPFPNNSGNGKLEKFRFIKEKLRKK